jgi:hypothetical protein
LGDVDVRATIVFVEIDDILPRERLKSHCTQHLILFKWIVINVIIKIKSGGILI